LSRPYGLTLLVWWPRSRPTFKGSARLTRKWPAGLMTLGPKELPGLVATPYAKPNPHAQNKGGACTCGRPSWGVVVDLCLELQAAREQLATVDEDLAELVAHDHFRCYCLIGGSALTEGAFRAKIRHELATGEHI